MMRIVSTGSFGPRETPCGTRGYSRVFTGTVRSAVDVGDTDKRLELVPDEVFVGDKSELTATINQACLPENEPEIQAGDKWLFYVRPKRPWDAKTPYIRSEGLEVPFDSPSKPLTEAEDDIATLRHLGGLTDKGILTGSVVRIGATYDDLNPTAVPNHRVVAKSWPSGSEYTAFTNLNGRFELVIPPGSYDVNAASEQGLREAEPWVPKDIELGKGLQAHIGNAIIRPRDCTEVDFSLLVDGKLAGRITTNDGKPAPFVEVAIIPVSPVHPQFTVATDGNGNFEVGGRQPGQYIVGVGLLAPFGSAEWKSRVYYPGVPTEEQAKIVELGDGEWRTNIDFKLLSDLTTR
ncbi:MAG: carboxypeptidase-like regulatory domain-containing protein [Candidatus Sulfotelmatobacter sp.]